MNGALSDLPLSELLARETDRELAKIDAALDAIETARAASDVEGERFAAWFRGDAHGNSVRAAERRHERALDVAYQATSDAARIDDRIAENWGYDVTDDAVVVALRTVRAELDVRRNRLRERTES